MCVCVCVVYECVSSFGTSAYKKQVIRVKKFVGLPPSALELLGHLS